jgi:hypothetical protein
MRDTFAFCRTVRSRQKMNGGIELAGSHVGISIILQRKKWRLMAIMNSEIYFGIGTFEIKQFFEKRDE